MNQIHQSGYNIKNLVLKQKKGKVQDLIQYDFYEGFNHIVHEALKMA